MEIRPVDVDDDAQVHAYAEAIIAGKGVGRENAPRMRVQDVVAFMRSTDPAEKLLSFDAVEDGETLGGADVWLSLLDNLEIARVEVVVAPGHRGRGVGAALLARVEDEARRDGRTTLVSSSRVPVDQQETHPYCRWAVSQGYARANVEIQRVQRLPVPDADLDAWAAEAAESAGGYELLTFVNEFPADLAPSLCTLMGQLAVDAPTGDVDYEEEAFTPERLEHRHAMLKAANREGWETVAVKDGVVCAQTTLSVPLDSPDVFQWGTFVHREHRGHRLGLAVKVANLRAVQAAHPHLERIATQNADTNEWMIAVNERMGFEVQEACVEWVKRLA